MSRAEMTLSKLPLFVNITTRIRPESVLPNAAHRFSATECPGSSRTRSGLLKNTCSHSQFWTLCLTRFLLLLPRSHWKPTKLPKTFSIRYYCIWQGYTCQGFSEERREKCDMPTAAHNRLAMKCTGFASPR